MTPRQPWTRAELDRLEQLVTGGYRYAEIAEQMDRTVYQVRGAAQRIGLQHRDRLAWHRMPEERTERLHRLIEECIEDRAMTCQGAAQYLNSIGEQVSRSWVHKQIQAMSPRMRKMAADNASRVRSLKLGIRRRAEESKRRAAA